MRPKGNEYWCRPVLFTGSPICAPASHPTRLKRHLHTADDLLEGLGQTLESQSLQLFFKSKKESLKHRSLPVCFHMLMRKIASPSMRPLPTPCTSSPTPHVPMWVVSGTTGRKKREQQRLSEATPTQISGSLGKTTSRLEGDLTGAGKTYKR